MKVTAEGALGVVAMILVGLVVLMRFLLTVALAILGFSFALIVILSPFILVGFIAWAIFN